MHQYSDNSCIIGAKHPWYQLRIIIWPSTEVPWICMLVIPMLKHQVLKIIDLVTLPQYYIQFCLAVWVHNQLCYLTLKRVLLPSAFKISLLWKSIVNLIYETWCYTSIGHDGSFWTSSLLYEPPVTTALSTIGSAIYHLTWLLSLALRTS